MKTMRSGHKRSGHKRTKRSQVTSKRSRSQATSKRSGHKRSGHKRSGHKRTKRSQVTRHKRGGTSSYRRALNQAKENIMKVDIDCENKSQAEIGEEMLALQLQLKKRFVLNRKEKKRKLRLLEQCYSEKSMNLNLGNIEITKPKPHYAINSSGRSNISGVSGSFKEGPLPEKPISLRTALNERKAALGIKSSPKSPQRKQKLSSNYNRLKRDSSEIDYRLFEN